MKIFKLLVIIFFHLEIQFDVFSALIQSQLWNRIQVNKTDFEIENTILSEIRLTSNIFCAAHANGIPKANSFCFHEGLCLVLQVTPCQGSFNTSGHEDLLKCYSKYDYNSLEYKAASFHEFVGCIWFAKKPVETPFSFWSINDKCKEVGGQLVSLENFLNKEDFEAFITKTGFDDSFIVGFIRDETSEHFKWLTGTTLCNDSFLWDENYPYYETPDYTCGQIYS
ncbi:hypothetical protein Avbf_17771 [Armadillidium vulgare]|nr:hypothetical protein Avbf_17771 [Armadillidium vulgare]